MKMDFDKYAQQLMQGEHGKALEKLTTSEAGIKLASQLNGEALEAAVSSGDGESLSKLLQSVLATPEGQNFARQVQKAVGKDGR
jgi:hypothetical protein